MTQIILFDDKTLHIDGYKSIIKFEAGHLCLNCRDKTLSIKGLKLRIDSFTDISMEISGIIKDISWVD